MALLLALKITNRVSSSEYYSLHSIVDAGIIRNFGTMDSRVKRRTGNEKINVKEAIEIVTECKVRDDKKLLAANKNIAFRNNNCVTDNMDMVLLAQLR